MAPITTPVVNINGTGREALLLERRVAHDALDHAIEMLRKVTVHGRDWQTRPASEFQQALREHEQRLANLRAVRDQLLDECIELL